ncbi:MAG: asparagine synthase (glutamine-hydrolyzing) [Candidatus Hodarchaeota archaeon]
MCGITGFWKQSAGEEEELSDQILKMTHTLHHRGPDDCGIWVDPSVGLALGHQRLPIIDLSPKAHQPMISGSGRYVITYNGEVYNFSMLRRELEERGTNFKSATDTEVILEAICQWGLEKAIKKCIGMFAFALWDRKGRILYLIRDRIGIKPLYYGENNEIFFFASELKALRAHCEFKPEIERGAIPLFLRFNNVPTPYSIYKGIKKLLPGHYLMVRQNRESSIHSYWDVNEVVRIGVEDPLPFDEREISNGLEKLLLDAVRIRMIADVPLGAFLSGGIDSSTVVTLMQAQSRCPVRTYTIGFFEKDFNEAIFSKKVAQHLGTDHTELYVSPEEAREVIPKLPEIYDEPFADYSQIPTYLISKLTRRHVTVALSGDGGDELFGGYIHYLYPPPIWNILRCLPPFCRRFFSGFIRLIPPTKWNALGFMTNPFLPRGWGKLVSGDKIHRFAEIIDSKDFLNFYSMIASHWRFPHKVVQNAQEPSAFFTKENDNLDPLDNYQKMMFADLLTYLPDDILTKVDRASMAVSLEVRVPFLDHRIVEFAWRIPTEMKFRNGKWKWILRKVLYRYIPPELIERDKMGFTLPMDMWLRGPLRDWAEDLLNEDRLGKEGFFSPQIIRDVWTKHLSAERNFGYMLWNVLMFQAWLDQWFR